MENESKNRIAHILSVPFTGLGLYNGFRGNSWLRHRINVFKQFLIPSLQVQTAQDFVLWVQWRQEERNNPQVIAFKEYIDGLGIKNVFTFSGVVLWDDKYLDDVAQIRLIDAWHGSMGAVINAIGDADTIYWTLQPSDDCYHLTALESIRKILGETDLQAIGFTKGYVCDYKTIEVREWNPETNPPFYTVKYDRETFIDPLKNFQYSAHKSHEFLPEKLKYGKIEGRGFLVGTHQGNISTVFNHPYTGARCEDVLKGFGLGNTAPLHIPFSVRKELFKRFPFKVQKKLRYWAGEKKWVLRPFFSWFYNWIRS